MSVIDEIKNRIDIVDLVSETVKLRKSGRTMTGFCPFHSNTRTPSFVVWPDTGTWKCFGACNTGGDIFTYVMKRDGLEFREALEWLARRAGVELEPRTPQAEAQDQQADRLREALAAATGYFHNLLRVAPQGQAAREHLASRGIADETVVNFQLGYSLDDWHALETYMRKREFSRQELVEAGLLVQRENDGSVYDRFRGRLMIPIRDARGHTIGFGARTLAHEEPKYINSPQSPLFDKGRVLFGLDMARNAIRTAGQAVIVEGYMDALGAHQAGFANVVASMGTALTEAQFRQLAKLCKKLILALDPDTAGVQAMLRGLDVARETLDREASPVFDARGLIGYEGHLQVDIRVLVMPGGRDPDEVIRDDPAGWPRLVENALPVVEYVMQMLSTGRNLNDPKEKAAFSRQVVPVIRDVADPVERAHYAQRLARMLRVDERVVMEQLGSAPVSRSRTLSAARPAQGITSGSAARYEPDLEAHCLAALLARPSALAQIDDTFAALQIAPLGPDDMENSVHREILVAIRGAVEWGAPTLVDIADRLDETIQPYLETLSAKLAAPLPALAQSLDWEREAVQSAMRVRERKLRRERQELDALIREALEEGQADVVQDLGEQAQRNAVAFHRLQKVLWPGETARMNTADPWRHSG